MAQPQIPNLPTEFFALLDFLRDPTKVEQAATMLQEKIDDFNQTIVDVVAAEDVNRARGQAKDDRATAARVLAAAQEEAARITAAAHARTDAAVEELAAEREKHESDVNVRMTELRNQTEAVRLREVEVERRAKEVEVKARDAAGLWAQAVSLRDEFTERKAKLDAALGR